MKVKISSLSKSVEFKSLINGKKINNKYLTIFFKKLSGKSNKFLNISFVAQKKIGNAVKRNKIKRRLRHIGNEATKKIKINFEYSYLILAKKNVLDENYNDIKSTLFKDFVKIK
jgi:ribonuclease P protein component